MVRDGKACMSRASDPVTIGVAPEVPPNAAMPVPEPATADTEAPGAPTSGLMSLYGEDGPRDEVLDMLPLSGIDCRSRSTPSRCRWRGRP